MTKDKILDDKIEEWLTRSGYPLEMRVAKFFMEEDFQVTQSEYYSDFESPETKREIDITIRSYDSYEPLKDTSTAELLIYATIECKAHQKKPWVLFKNAGLSLFDIEIPIYNKTGNGLRARSRKDIGNCIFTEMASSSATGITVAFNDKGAQDTPYKAIMGALKAAEDKVREELEIEKEIDKDPSDENKYAAFIFPVVITDAKLFEAELDENGKISTNQVNYSSVITRYPRREKSGTVVFIFNENSLEFLNEALCEFRETLKNNLPRLLRRSKKRKRIKQAPSNTQNTL